MSLSPLHVRLPAVFALVLGISSCALPPGSFSTAKPKGTKTGSPLQPGVRYEVRKALTAKVPFRPEKMERYYFVVEASRPPMLAAANKSSHRMNVRTTAYCHDESDHLAYGARNALGTPLKFGTLRSAAADWSRYPVGTRFRIHGQPGVIYEVDDYGSALVGTGTIDIYKPTRGMMNAWGVRHVDIEVLEWGSWERSMDIMRDRMKWPHVRAMMRGIEERLQLTRAGSRWGRFLTASI